MKKKLLFAIVFSIVFVTSSYAASGSSGNADNKSVYERGYYIIKKAKKLEKKGKIEKAQKHYKRALKYFVKGNEHKAPLEGEMGKTMLEKNVPPFLELFEQAVELGDAKVYPCSMAMDMLEIKSEDLFDYVGEPMGLTKFISDVNEGQVWSF